MADVSFEVQRGEIFGLLGPNGAGKTTTVECLQGLRRPDGGTARVLSLDPFVDAPALRGRIGSQLQESALPERIKVWEALDLFGAISPRARDWKELLAQWGLAEKANAYFSTLSGGQRQRLFIALALVSNPEVVFLDEMTTGLDPVARRVAWQLIETVRASGVTVVLVTHFMEEAEKLCDRIAVIDKGHIAATGTPQQLIAQHGTEVRVSFSYSGNDVSWLEKIPAVRLAVPHAQRVEVQCEGVAVVRVAAGLAEHGVEPPDFRVDQPTLEDVFLRITGAPE